MEEKWKSVSGRTISVKPVRSLREEEVHEPIKSKSWYSNCWKMFTGFLVLLYISLWLNVHTNMFGGMDWIHKIGGKYFNEGMAGAPLLFTAYRFWFLETENWNLKKTDRLLKRYYLDISKSTGFIDSLVARGRFYLEDGILETSFHITLLLSALLNAAYFLYLTTIFGVNVGRPYFCGLTVLSFFATIFYWTSAYIAPMKEFCNVE